VGSAFDPLAFLAEQGLASGSGLTLRALAGGYWNQVYRVTGRGLDLVVKRFHSGFGPLRFPNLPESEAAALAHLAPSGAVPAPLGYWPPAPGESPVLVYRYVEGQLWQRGAGAVGRALAAIHALPPPSPPHPFRALDDEAEAMLEEGELLLPGLADRGRVKDLEASAPTPVPLPSAPQPVVVHSDCGPGNLIQRPDGRVTVIDWQCCGLGDPAEDLYAFLSPAFQVLSGRAVLTAEEKGAFLAAYATPAAVERLAAKRPFYAWRMLAYCAYRVESLAADDPAGARRYAAAFDAEAAEIGGKI